MGFRATHRRGFGSFIVLLAITRLDETKFKSPRSFLPFGLCTKVCDSAGPITDSGRFGGLWRLTKTQHPRTDRVARHDGLAAWTCTWRTERSERDQIQQRDRTGTRA